MGRNPNRDEYLDDQNRLKRGEMTKVEFTAKWIGVLFQPHCCGVPMDETFNTKTGQFVLSCVMCGSSRIDSR